MKQCELCKEEARTYCESDQARLCWACDAMVHSANFLVARHSRAVLCHACHSPTPWISSGAELAVAVATCTSCLAGDTSAGDDDQSRETNNDDDDDDDGESHVVPWSSPPPASSSSGEEDDGESSSCSESPMKKRSRQDLIEFLSPKRRRSSELGTRASWSAIRSSSTESRPFRDLRRTVRAGQVKPAGSVDDLAVEKFRHHRDVQNLSGSRAVDPDSAESPSRVI